MKKDEDKTIILKDVLFKKIMTSAVEYINSQKDLTLEESMTTASLVYIHLLAYIGKSYGRTCDHVLASYFVNMMPYLMNKKLIESICKDIYKE